MNFGNGGANKPSPLAALSKAEGDVQANQPTTTAADSVKTATDTVEPAKPYDGKAIDAKLQPQGTPINHQPTAGELGLDLKGIDDSIKLNDELNIARTGGVPDSAEAIYSSHPIANFQIGAFQFEKGSLKFTGKEPEGRRESDFEKLLETLPAIDRMAVRKVNADKASELAKMHIASNQATKGFDSGVGRDALERLHKLSPTVGTQAVDSFEKLPQTDNNIPVKPTEPVDNEGKTGLDQGAHTAEGQ